MHAFFARRFIRLHLSSWMDVVDSVDFLHKNLVEISRGVFARCRHDISISRTSDDIQFSCVQEEKDQKFSFRTHSCPTSK